LTTGERASPARVAGAHRKDGCIVLAGADVTAQHAHTTARRGIARRPHNALIPPLTVRRVSIGRRTKI
jgi:ABC-type branched-subunit amino acid transport system ATPase component